MNESHGEKWAEFFDARLEEILSIAEVVWDKDEAECMAADLADKDFAGWMGDQCDIAHERMKG